MWRLRAALAWAVATGLLSACTAITPLPVIDNGPSLHTIRVVSDGWHTAIVLRRSDVVATGLIPETSDIPESAYLEFSWGDREFFPAKVKTLRARLAAAFIVTPAIMHVVALDRVPELIYPDAEVVHLALTDDAFRLLVSAIDGDFERTASGRARPVPPGRHPGGKFYHAHGDFHFLNTCNTWTARKLRASGVDVVPFRVITARDLVSNLRTAIGAVEP